MKNRTQTLHHLTGDHAYLIYWQQVYHCKPRLSSIMAIDLNLEIVIDEEQNLLAFRYDLPDEMQCLVSNRGKWQYINDNKLSPLQITKLQRIINRFKYNICMN